GHPWQHRSDTERQGRLSEPLLGPGTPSWCGPAPPLPCTCPVGLTAFGRKPSDARRRSRPGERCVGPRRTSGAVAVSAAPEGRSRRGRRSEETTAAHRQEPGDGTHRLRTGTIPIVRPRTEGVPGCPRYLPGVPVHHVCPCVESGSPRSTPGVGGGLPWPDVRRRRVCRRGG